ncbi:MAG: T9SS type A sorting domain-containing protein [Chitinophagales bacterium]
MNNFRLNHITFFIFINLFTCFCFSQVPEIEWQNKIGSVETDVLNCIIKTSDGGFLAAGSSSSGIGTDKTEPLLGVEDGWVIKLNVYGTIEWQRTLGGTLIDYVTSIVESNTGGYLIGAYSGSDTSANKTEPSIAGDFWILKLDTAGNIEWQNSIGGDCNDYLSSVDQTNDGGFILGGSSCSGISLDKLEAVIGEFDYWIIKIDSIGEIEWQNTIGGDLEDELTSLQQTDDGGYILGGFSDSNISGDKTEGLMGTEEDTYDYWVIKLDSTGEIKWQNTIGGFWDDRLLDIKENMDGGYLLGGYSNSGINGDKTEDNCGGYDYWVVKLDSIGNILWQNTIGGEDDDYLHKIAVTSDEKFILAGNSESEISCDKSESNIGERDFWPVQIDSIGNIQWQKTLGGMEDDYLWAIARTDDGWPILAGNAVSGISGDKSEPNCGLSELRDAWIIKFDSAGNIQWQNTIMGLENDHTESVQQTTDDGYIIACYSGSPIGCDKTEDRIGSGDYWVVKLDSSGNIAWQNTIGGNDLEELNSITQTSDGGYLLGGNSWSPISGDKTENPVGGLGNSDYWVVKLNAEGVIQWQNTIGGNLGDYLNVVKATPDGGYILGGNSISDMSVDKSEDQIGSADYWVVKINSIGLIEWDNTIGGTSYEALNDLQLTDDSGYILSGFSKSDIGFDKSENSFGEYDYWVIKLDSLGSIEWQKTIGGDLDDFSYSIFQTNDYGYIIGGYSSSGISGIKNENSMGSTDCWVVKIDSTGNIEWQNTIGGANEDYLTHGLRQTPDGDYVIAGYSNSGISGDKTDSIGDYDYWILKLDPSGNIMWQKTVGGNKTDLSLHGFDLTSDNGFITGGSSNSGISGDKTETVCGDPETSDWWIVKLQCAEQIFYADSDGDTFGDNLITEIACTAPTGFVTDSADCDDLNTLIYPGAPETLNGTDDNCNDLIDEGLVEIIDLLKQLNFSIYPNPNNGTFTISAPLRSLQETSTFSLKIYNSFGQLIFSNELCSASCGNLTNGIINETISTDNLPSGIYFARIGDENPQDAAHNYQQQKLIIE